MTISIHMQTEFEDYDFFKSKMDEILTSYPNIEKCLYGRSRPEEFAKKYFNNTNVICQNPRLVRFKIQNLYQIVEQSDLSIFFYRDDVKVGSQLTKKTITRAKNLEKEFIIVEYELGDNS